MIYRLKALLSAALSNSRKIVLVENLKTYIMEVIYSLMPSALKSSFSSFL